MGRRGRLPTHDKAGRETAPSASFTKFTLPTPLLISSPPEGVDVGPRRRKTTGLVTASGPPEKGTTRPALFTLVGGPAAATLLVAALGSSPSRRRARLSLCSFLQLPRGCYGPASPSTGSGRVLLGLCPLRSPADPPHPHSVRYATQPLLSPHGCTWSVHNVL